MPDEIKRRAGLPEAYWTLHRNSLLFSTALLVFSLPSVSINPHQTFLIFEVQAIAEPLVLTGLMIAATYSLVAFVVEWITEARGQGTEELELLRSAAEEVSEVVGLIKAQADSAEGRHLRSIEEVVKTRDELTKALRSLKGQFDSLSPPDKSFVDHFTRQARAELGFLLIEMAREFESEPIKIKAIYENQDASLKPFDPILDNLAKQILASTDLRTVKPDLWWIKEEMRNILKRQREMIKHIPEIIKPLVEQTSRFRKLNRLLNLDRGIVTIRIWVIGVGFPLAVYVAAVALLLVKAVTGPLAGVAASIGYMFGPPL
jgi:hypothetical protein